jgi:tRNA-specific 2-thiouridylase
VVMEQGIHVEGINFYTGFCVEGHTHAIRKKDRARPKRNNALWSAEQLGIKLHIVDIIEEYKDVVLNPGHGYGSNLNPCLDCKIFMVEKAHEWIVANDFDFIVTGEVIGQRPMSQRRDTMPLIARDSGATDRLVRLAGPGPFVCFQWSFTQATDGAGSQLRALGLCTAGRRLLFPH